MEFKMVTPVIVSFALILTGCNAVTELYLTESNVTWSKAKAICKERKDSLVRIKDLQDYPNVNFNIIWSSVKGTFTPWITNKGCYMYYGGPLLIDQRKIHTIHHNTVGNCYHLCNSKDITEGGCKPRTAFYFGLKLSNCICFCEVTWLILHSLADSGKCNKTCVSLVENGYCGGENNFISMYSKDTQSYEDEMDMGGFCLTCVYSQSHQHTIYITQECNNPNLGYCVDERNQISSVSLRKTMDDYWKFCKSRNLYLVGLKEMHFCLGNMKVMWTGIRKYKISKEDNAEDNCYSIKKLADSAWIYEKRRCAENLPFICKTDRIYSNQSTEATKTTESKRTHITNSFLQYSVTVSQNANSTTNGTSKGFIKTTQSSIQGKRKIESKSGIVGATAGSGVALLIIGVSITLVLLYLKKRRKTQKPSMKFTNATYGGTKRDIQLQFDKSKDTISINTISNQCRQPSKFDKDDIYFEKAEGEYDSLHTSRQKKSFDGDPQYNSVTECRNYYSSAAKTKYLYQDGYDNDYSTMAGNQNNNYSALNYDNTCRRSVADEKQMYSHFETPLHIQDDES